MLFKSLMLSQASGSIAGATFSRNAGGMYVRSRALPTNPNTENQQIVRSAMANLVVQWRDSLSEALRQQWNTYAFNTPTLNKLGESTHKTGQQMFLRGNIARIQAGLPLAINGPSLFDVGDFTDPSPIIADSSASTISIAFTAVDGWATEEDSALLIYQSRPQNPTRNFGKGPYQLASMVLGVDPGPAVSPHVFASLFPMNVGQRFFFKFNVTRADGRFSGSRTASTIVVA